MLVKYNHEAKLDEIFNTYGLENQIAKLEEELGELTEAEAELREAVLGEKELFEQDIEQRKQHFLEELGDVINVGIQITHFLGYTSDDLTNVMYDKVYREIGRILKKKRQSERNNAESRTFGKRKGGFAGKKGIPSYAEPQDFGMDAAFKGKKKKPKKKRYNPDEFDSEEWTRYMLDDE